MKKYISFILVAVVVACSPEKKENAADLTVVNESLAPEAFKAKIESQPDGVVLDVRTPEEVSEGVISGAKNIDFKATDFETQLATLDKNKTYFVYCASGGRSGKTCGLMKDKGFTKVYSLEGGLNAWKEKGLPITPQ